MKYILFYIFGFLFMLGYTFAIGFMSDNCYKYGKAFDPTRGHIHLSEWNIVGAAMMFPVTAGIAVASSQGTEQECKDQMGKY